MTSLRQIEANRRNALLSTGPTSEAGKHRSRRNAVRHGLTAETVVETIEDIEDYRGFEAAVIASYDARNAVERELVLRLASLLWRLRRATAIETDLLRIQAETIRDLRFSREVERARNVTSAIFASRRPSVPDVDHDEAYSCMAHHDVSGSTAEPSRPLGSARGLAHCFLRLANNDNGVFDRLQRYESALSRQVFRVLFLLRSLKTRC